MKYATIFAGKANFILVLVASVLVAVGAVKWAYFKVLKIAKVKNLVDNPEARKLQKTPIPVMGGIAVFFGIFVGVLTSAVVSRAFIVPVTADMLPITLAMLGMLYIGAMDDIIGLSPASRLLIEILAIVVLIFGGGGCIDSLHGIFGVTTFSWWIAVPLTIFAGVGIINAINMIDGVNGQSSGLCMMMSILFGIEFLKVGDTSNAILAFIVVVSLMPFYIHNVFGNKSRMFIGDAGTMVMGLLLVWFVISVLRSDSPVAYYSQINNVGLVAMVLAFLSVPVFDTLRVMTMRMAHGKNPFSADKTHLHHVFIAAGISHFITSSTVIFIDLIVTGIWALSYLIGLSVTWQLVVVILASMLLVWGTFAFIRYCETYHTHFMHWLSHFSVSTHLGRTEWWKSISAWLDRPEGDQSLDIDDERMAELEEQFDHEEDPKQADRKRVFEYMKGKSEVHVKDIISYSEADSLRVYPILFELEQEGIILVIKRDSLGSPEIVTIKG